MVSLLRDLFILNERVALLGRWKHGFFSMVPVGATNVGSIIVNFDEELRTNVPHPLVPPGKYEEVVYPNGIQLKKGEEMGGFKLGSTVVVVFEAPIGFKFENNVSTFKRRDHGRIKVRMGGALGRIKSE